MGKEEGKAWRKDSRHVGLLCSDPRRCTAGPLPLIFSSN